MLWWVFLALLSARVVQVAHRARRHLPSSEFILFWGALWVSASVTAGAARGGSPWCALLFLVELVLLMPWTVTSRILIPLGMPRAAYRLGALAGWTWGRDRRCGGLVAAARTVLRRRAPDRARLAWIEAERDRQPGFHATHALVTGLVAAARGDLAGARVMLASVDEIAPRTSPCLAQALAREWLVADAVERGDWARARDLARGSGPRTRGTRLLGQVAARLTRARAAVPTPALWLSWLLAPGRRHTLALVRRAARVPVVTGPEQAAPIAGYLETSLRPDPHHDALLTHVAVLRGQAGVSRADALRNLARAWDRALDDPATRDRIQRRAAALGARNGDRALAALTGTVARDLAAMAREHDLPVCRWSADSLTLREAERLLREQLTAEIELAFDAASDRVAQDRRLSAADEWREWLSLREQHRRAIDLGGMDLRRLVFPHVYGVVGRLAVWLWNERGQHLMANAMFRWLLDEAVAVGDARAIELQRRNWDERL